MKLFMVDYLFCNGLFYIIQKCSRLLSFQVFCRKSTFLASCGVFTFLVGYILVNSMHFILLILNLVLSLLSSTGLNILQLILIHLIILIFLLNSHVIIPLECIEHIFILVPFYPCPIFHWETRIRTSHPQISGYESEQFYLIRIWCKLKAVVLWWMTFSLGELLKIK